MIKLSDYNIPDYEFVKNNPNGVFLWIPDKIYVVLGQRDKPKNALTNSITQNSDIVITQRPSGGHSVVLSPKTLVISIHGKSPDISKTKQWFSICNKSVLASLQKCGITNSRIDGISDISINNKKILGSSVYRGKDISWWHAVLNISENAEFIASFLAHPTTEPEYRKKRPHSEFITSLKDEQLELNISDFKNYLIQEITKNNLFSL